MDIKITRYLKNKFIIFLTFFTDYSYDENDYAGMAEFTFNLDDYLNHIFEVVDTLENTFISYRLWVDSSNVDKVLNKLNEKEQIIVSKRFFDGRTQMEVAEEIGISQAQVSRLEKSAIEHIKRFYK